MTFKLDVFDLINFIIHIIKEVKKFTYKINVIIEYWYIEMLFGVMVCRHILAIFYIDLFLNYNFLIIDFLEIQNVNAFQS